MGAVQGAAAVGLSRRSPRRNGARFSIEEKLFELLALRQPEATICPLDVAHAMASHTAWRDWMPLVRGVAQRLQ
jgi:hypothetical protein